MGDQLSTSQPGSGCAASPATIDSRRYVEESAPHDSCHSTTFSRRFGDGYSRSMKFAQWRLPNAKRSNPAKNAMIIARVTPTIVRPIFQDRPVRALGGFIHELADVYARRAR